MLSAPWPPRIEQTARDVLKVLASGRLQASPEASKALQSLPNGLGDLQIPERERSSPLPCFLSLSRHSKSNMNTSFLQNLQSDTTTTTLHHISFFSAFSHTIDRENLTVIFLLRFKFKFKHSFPKTSLPTDISSYI